MIHEVLELMHRLERIEHEIEALKKHYKIHQIRVVGHTKEAMATNTQSFDNSKPITFTVVGLDAAGNTVPIDQTKVTLSLSTTSGTVGALAGDVLTPQAGVGGVCVVSASYETFTATDDVTITDPIIGIQVIGA